jgi:spoIIIJ-associated protein
MTAVERKIVHEFLKDDPEVQTMSEGMEPNRYVVVIPRLSAD